MEPKLKLDRKQLLNTDKALEYVNAERAKKGIEPIKYDALLKHLRQNEVKPYARASHNKGLWNPADLQCAIDETYHPNYNIPEGYQRLSDLIDDINEIRDDQCRSHFTVSRLTTILWTHKCPKVKVNLRPNGIANYYDTEKVFDIILNLREKRQNYELYRPATKEQLMSPDWVTTTQAAALIGCTRQEINGFCRCNRQKAAIGLNNKLIVDWKACKEALSWRQLRTIIKFMGKAGFELVKQTRESKWLAYNAFGKHYRAWYVPELLTAFRDNNVVCTNKRKSVTKYEIMAHGLWSIDITRAFINDIRELYGYKKYQTNEACLSYLISKNIQPIVTTYGHFYKKEEIMAVAFDLPRESKRNKINYIQHNFGIKGNIPDGHITRSELANISGLTLNGVKYRCQRAGVKKIELTPYAIDPNTGNRVHYVYERQAALVAVQKPSFQKI